MIDFDKYMITELVLSNPDMTGNDVLDFLDVKYKDRSDFLIFCMKNSIYNVLYGVV
ncbi:MAG: hypothetical protein ACTSQH_00100 [Candidatus Hodarchaeales archaeon]